MPTLQLLDSIHATAFSHTLLYYVAGNPQHYLALSIRFHLRWRNACVCAACCAMAKSCCKRLGCWSSRCCCCWLILPFAAQVKSSRICALPYKLLSKWALRNFALLRGFPCGKGLGAHDNDNSRQHDTQETHSHHADPSPGHGRQPSTPNYCLPSQASFTPH